MITTITTDASYSWSLHRGSYAFWIVSNSGKIAKAGMLKQKVTRAEQCEFMCIINALHVLSTQDWGKTTKIIINTDCLNVIHLVKRNKELIRRYNLKWGKNLVHKMEQLIYHSKLRGAEVEFRHIKAHQEISTSRQWVNDWCDKEAKRSLMKFVRQHEINPKRVSV